MFGELPLEVRTTTRSPGRPSPAIWRAKTSSKPKSLPMQESNDPSEERATAGRDRLFRSNRPTSSVAKCAASAALPPLPQIRSFPPPRSVPMMRRAASSIAGRIPGSACSARVLSAREASNVMVRAKWAEDLPATENFGVLGGVNPQGLINLLATALLPF